MLGGSDLTTLFVTSASDGLTQDALESQPLAGAVFAVPVETPGIPEERFAH
jgi:L-arabinonolactonase